MGKKKKKHTNPKAQIVNPVAISGKKSGRQSFGVYFRRWVNTVKASYSDIYTL